MSADVSARKPAEHGGLEDAIGRPTGACSIRTSLMAGWVDLMLALGLAMLLLVAVWVRRGSG